MGMDFAPITHFARSTSKNGRRFIHNPLVAKNKSLPKRFIEVCCHEQSSLSKQFELAGEWEDVWTFEEGNNGTIWSFIDMETDKYPSNEEFHYLLVGM